MQYTAGKSGDFFAQLIEKRRHLIEALDENQGEVNLDIFEDFYPDRAHFVYELLQNAEDAGATEVHFLLKADGLICEHNGQRTFTEADVSAITGIHNSTKGKDKNAEKIGKFGVGFKSVFVYTQSPTVRSGDYSFRIVKLILPELIEPDSSLGRRTRFEFPFDNPKKLPPDAFDEISAGLRDLDETTLLFLSSLQTICWSIEKDGSGEVLRHRRSEFHFEVLKQEGARTTSSSHFLKFDEPVEGLGTQHVAIAFPLDFLPGVRSFELGKPLAEQMKIVPASPGRVAVFFTAAKEASGLFFHLHGPFVPELSRASIKETPVNEPLYGQLAALSARCLHSIRDLGLLTPEFLGVLPLKEDQMPERYQGIREAIVAEMQSHPLTPTYQRGHAEASRLIQARASLKDLLSDEDIEYLVEYKDQPPLWAIGATQRNSRIDNFLSALKIRQWSVEEFLESLKANTTTVQLYVRIPPYIAKGPDEAFMSWLGGKSADWMRQLYSVLHDELFEPGSLPELKDLKIVPLQGGGLGVGSRSYFPSTDAPERDLPTVDAALYTAGKSKTQQDKARAVLLGIGVREIGEAEEIEIILGTRYTKEADIPDDKTYLNDLRRFVALVEKQPDRKVLFRDAYIFHGADDNWHTPGAIFLDGLYKQTDLSAYFGPLGLQATRQALHDRYLDCSVEPDRVGSFAEAAGAITKLPIVRTDCSQNPKWSYLRMAPGARDTSPVNRDFVVPNLQTLLETPDIALSRLVWRTLVALPNFSDYFQAVFRHNQTSGSHRADSRFIVDLRTAKWVPQSDGSFVLAEDALRELLPEGFAFDPAYAGLKAIGFGEAVARKSAEARQKDEIAKAAGFESSEALDRAHRFMALPKEDQENVLSSLSRSPDLSAVPDRDPLNPGRRVQNVAEDAKEAPDKTSVIRSRSVSVGIEVVKDSAEEYLLRHYRNAHGDMTCQICKGPLPFKLEDGSDFFEVVDFIPGLSKRHGQNYLALCPNHSAMYRHANATKAELRERVKTLATNEIEVELGQRVLTIYLSKIHVIDMKAVIKADEELASGLETEVDGDEAADG